MNLHTIPDPASIHASVTVERKQPDLPRFAVIPSSLLMPWKLAETTVVEMLIDGIAVDRRSIHRWDDERWFVSITERDCRAVGIDTGSRIELRLAIASTDLPDELAALLRDDPAAERTWAALSPGGQRMLREEIASAKQSVTRTRRARRALLGE